MVGLALVPYDFIRKAFNGHPVKAVVVAVVCAVTNVMKLKDMVNLAVMSYFNNRTPNTTSVGNLYVLFHYPKASNMQV